MRFTLCATEHQQPENKHLSDEIAVPGSHLLTQDDAGGKRAGM